MQIYFIFTAMSFAGTLFQKIANTPERYRRVVSGIAYEHKLDGIRFLALTGVILCHVSSHTLYYGGFMEKSDYVRTTFIYNLFQGVSLLFVLSSYLLSSYLFRVDIKSILKKYYARRFWRIFPAYAIVLTLCMVILVFVRHAIGTEEGLKHYFASLFFGNNVVYPLTHPVIMPVSWTVELEVQYYCLLPFVILAYKRFKTLFRILSILALLFMPVLLDRFSWYEHTNLPFQVPYFLAGILLADLLHHREEWAKALPINTFLTYLIGFGAVFLLLWINWYYYTFAGIKIDLAPILIFILMFLILCKDFISRTMQNKWICFIGNMGYSLYLTHMLVISFAGKIMLHLKISDFFMPNYILQVLLLYPLVVGFGFVFYRFVEFPLMKKR